MSNPEKIVFIEQMKSRTKKACIQLIFFTRKLENKKEHTVITYQIIRSSTSVAVNYRASSRAISERALYSKMKIVEEEADETIFGLEILEEIIPDAKETIRTFIGEYDQILKIISKANYTLRNKLKKQ